MVYGVFAASATTTLKTTELSFEFLDVQQLKPFAGEHRNSSQIEFRLGLLAKLICDSVLGKFGFGPFSAVIVAKSIGQSVGFQDLRIIFDDF